MSTCVYTAVFGKYDGLMDQPVATDSETEFVCFTDDPELTSDTWTIRVIPPAFAEDSVRSARLLKILGHESLDTYDATLWIDASVLLRMDPDVILAHWLTDSAEIALAHHSYREQLVDEFDEIIRLNYDDRARVYEQLTDYAMAYPEALSARPLWTGMLARRNTPAVHETMRTWANHVLRYSRRDQLSVLVALREGKADYVALDLDNFDAPTHRWPVIPHRKIGLGKAAPLPAGPLVADLRRALLRIEELETGLGDVTGRAAQRDDAVADAVRLTGALAAAHRELDIARRRLQAQSGVRGAVRNLGANVRGATARRLTPPDLDH